MKASRFRLNRRAMLRGLGGAAVGLPALEIMLDGQGRAHGQGMPKRYIVCFTGTSLGADGDPLHNDYVPSTVGANYDLKTALAPLAPVKSEVSVVSGLSIPTANGGPVPAGGRRDDFHVSSLSPLLSGVRSPTNTSSAGVTSDQLVAEAIAGDTPFKSLVYRVQVGWYLSVSAPYGRDMMSYKKDGAGKVVPIPPTVSPLDAWKALFSNFTPPVGTMVDPRADLMLRARKSVLDLVAGNTLRLMPRLGSGDRQRLSRHLDELRDLERRVAAVPPPAASSGTNSCRKPDSPGPDSPPGGAQGVDAAGENTYAVNLGYSGEEERARLFCDLIHMAVACDLSRVVSLMFTMFQSHMNMYPLTGHRCDCHEVGHNGDPARKGTLAVSEVIAWHMKHFAYLVGKLRDTPEGAGRLIDNTVLVMLNEGGHGLDTATGRQYTGHSTQNMACLIAGRAGGLKPGQHVVADGKHPANVLVSAMGAVGAGGGALGEVSGNIPALFG
jgi:hypothetical protein